MKNRYAHGSKLDEPTFRRMVRLFAADRDATHIAAELGVNRKTVNDYLRRIRLRLAAHEVLQSLRETGAGQPLKEVFFLVGPQSGPRGVEVLSGVVLENGILHAEVLPEMETQALRALLRGRLVVRGWSHRERAVGFAANVDLDFLAGEALPERRQGLSPSELVTAFLAHARTRLLMFRGIGADFLRLHLKETELRFNLDSEALTKLVLRLLTQQPLAARAKAPDQPDAAGGSQADGAEELPDDADLDDDE